MTTRQKEPTLYVNSIYLGLFLQVVKITNLDNQVIQFKHFDNERSLMKEVYDEKSLEEMKKSRMFRQ